MASVPLPVLRGLPVEGTIPTNGWACSVDLGHCAYCCHGLKGMESHVRTHTNHPFNLKNGYCEGVALQVLFSMFSHKYFEMEPALASTPDTDPLTHIIHEYMSIPPGNLMPPSPATLVDYFTSVANPEIPLSPSKKEHMPFM
jgi:hypothetical protein